MAGDDPALAGSWSSIVDSAPAGPLCLETPSRDLVYVGSVEFTNQTPGFAPTSLDLTLETYQYSTQTGIRFEIQYGDSGGCDSSGHPTISPDMSGASWGPVPVAFTVYDVNGPNGVDRSLLDEVDTVGIRLSTSSISLLPGANMRAKDGDTYWLEFDLPLPSGNGGAAADTATSATSSPIEDAGEDAFLGDWQGDGTYYGSEATFLPKQGGGLEGIFGAGGCRELPIQNVEVDSDILSFDATASTPDHTSCIATHLTYQLVDDVLVNLPADGVEPLDSLSRVGG